MVFSVDERKPLAPGSWRQTVARGLDSPAAMVRVRWNFGLLKSQVQIVHFLLNKLYFLVIFRIHGVGHHR
jgi:hypothetical protein